MARIGVSYSQIEEAANRIRNDGDEPTVDRVRDYLGTGSKSTIAPLLKRWRQQQQTGSSAGVLPQALQQAVESLYQGLLDQADERIRISEQTLAEREAATQAEVASERLRFDAIAGENEHLKTRLQQQEYELIAARQSLEISRVQNARQEARLQDNERQISEQSARIKELRQENQDIRQHFDHYQQRAAEDRQIERDQHQQAVRQLQDNLQQQQEQRLHAEQQGAALRQQLTDSQERSREQRLTISQLELQQAHSQKQLQSLEKQLEQRQEQDRLRDTRERELRQCLALAEARADNLQQEKNTLTERLEQARLQLGISQDQNRRQQEAIQSLQTTTTQSNHSPAPDTLPK